MLGGQDDALQAGIVETVRSAKNIEEAIFLLRDGLGLAHVSFHLNVSGAAPLDYPYVRTTLPSQWISRYVLRTYVGHDPVMREGFSSLRPFSWHELEMSEKEREFMEDARSHGIGAQGYSIPTVDRFSRRSLLSLTADLDLGLWAGFIRRHASSVIEISQVLHQKALNELGIGEPSGATLAPRERECLLWTARGKDSKDIAGILDLSEYTVRSYLRTARQKLQCRTLSQAVATATRQRIIDP
ncbi:MULTISPECIES: LuxR family transcriptional regulator [Chelativorans]|jgi:DNA-binding CsgD family transcriptional regulator|uniref:Transcriptional regulator, LuxR family n=1 Tax=Chelativorans sp. (strain BNC1) TaxID=266779 RepID=Q11IH2_CHESB|nr:MULTISPECIES: LuxR family transcriptional regulator [Chelativorans]